DKRHLIVSRENRLWLVDLSSAQGRYFGEHEGAINSAAFSPDSTRIASCGGGGLRKLWGVSSGGRRSPRGRALWTNDAAFSPDGKRLVSAEGDGTIRLWDISAPSLFEEKTPIESVILGEHEGQVFRVIFSPDGLRLASSGGDKTIRLWDISSP